MPLQDYEFMAQRVSFQVKTLGIYVKDDLARSIRRASTTGKPHHVEAAVNSIRRAGELAGQVRDNWSNCTESYNTARGDLIVACKYPCPFCENAFFESFARSIVSGLCKLSINELHFYNM